MGGRKHKPHQDLAQRTRAIIEKDHEPRDVPTGVQHEEPDDEQPFTFYIETDPARKYRRNKSYFRGSKAS